MATTPKFTDAKPTPDGKPVEETDATKDAKLTDARSDEHTEARSDEEVPMILHKEYFTDQNGVRQSRDHGPMPVSEWAEYERKHNL